MKLWLPSNNLYQRLASSSFRATDPNCTICVALGRPLPAKRERSSRSNPSNAMGDLPCDLALRPEMRSGAMAVTHRMKGNSIMSNLLAAVGSFRRWSRLRAERRAMWWATDQLSRLPDDVLNDIGVSRDEIICASRTGSFPRARRHITMF